MNPHKAHNTLGVYKEPAGIQTEQFRQLKQKSDAVTQFLWSVPLRREETRLFYNACYLPSIGYPLTSTYFEYDQLDKIQRKAMSIIVARCGYNRHTKKEVVYGPIEYGGADFYHLYRWQSYQQIKYFMRQIRANTPVGNMIRCSLAWIQWSVGVSFPILHQVTTSLPHIESKWVASIRSFLKEAQLTIQMDSDYIPSKQREADEYIMDLVLRSEKFSPAEIRKINYCRLFLQAVTISDLSMATGTELDNSKFRGTPSLMSSTTSTLTPHQENPSESMASLAQSEHTVEQHQDREITSSIRVLVAHGARTTATAFRIQVQPRIVDQTESRGSIISIPQSIARSRIPKPKSNSGHFKITSNGETGRRRTQ